LAAKIAEFENAIGKHDESIKTIVQTLQELIIPPDNKKWRIGF